MAKRTVKNRAKKRTTSQVGRTAVGMPRSAPVITSTPVAVRVPRITQNRDGLSVRLNGSERFDTVFIDATGGASISTYTRANFNPASSTLIWLPNLARSYSTYRVHSLTFRYVPAVATSQGGSVTLGWFRDAFDAGSWIGSPSAAKLEVTSHSHTNAVWDGFSIHLAERDLHQGRPWFEVGSPTSPGVDAVPGTLGWAAIVPTAVTAGTTLTLGRIYVDYDITLANPVALSDNASFRVQADGLPDRERHSLPYDPDLPTTLPSSNGTGGEGDVVAGETLL